MVWLTLPIVLLLCGALLVLGAATLLAFGLTHPPRMSDGRALALLHRLTPGDLGIRFADVNFDVIDESRPPKKIRIAGWWMPSDQPSDRCVILLHGYADAKVGAIAWAPIFHSLGWNLLAIDHRAHGESGGTAATAGHFERHDLSHVIDQLREQQPAGTKTLVLFGVSMGSAIATQTLAMRQDIDGAIFESFVGDFVFASRVHTDLIGLPGGFTRWLSAHIAAWMVGADFHNDTAMVALPRVTCPVLLILGTTDPFADSAEVERIAGQMPNIQMWRPEGVDHVLAMSAGYEDYAGRIAAFLNSIQK